MYKRTYDAIINSIDDIPQETCMCKAQFGKAEFSTDVAFAITCRVDASGAYCIIEKIDDNESEDTTSNG